MQQVAVGTRRMNGGKEGQAAHMQPVRILDRCGSADVYRLRLADGICMIRRIRLKIPRKRDQEENESLSRMKKHVRCRERERENVDFNYSA